MRKELSSYLPYRCEWCGDATHQLYEPYGECRACTNKKIATWVSTAEEHYSLGEWHEARTAALIAQAVTAVFAIQRDDYRAAE